MYVPGTFTPKDFMIPKKILHRIDAFEHAITPLFKKRQGNNNLFPHQKRALYSLQKTKTLSSANAITAAYTTTTTATATSI
eukprot:12239068-Ditylum_brightwellii.AAC.1